MAIPLPYDPAELNFRAASKNELACLMHEDFCIVSVPYELEDTLKNLYQGALISNSIVVIERKSIPNILLSEYELDKFIKIELSEQARQISYFFDYSQISYSINLLGEGGRIIFNPPFHKKENIQITSEVLMMELIRQIDFIRKYKKTVNIDFNFLRENAGNKDAHGLKLLRIDPRIPSY